MADPREKDAATSADSEPQEQTYRSLTADELEARLSGAAEELQRTRESYEEAKEVSQKLLEFEVCL